MRCPYTLFTRDMGSSEMVSNLPEVMVSKHKVGSHCVPSELGAWSSGHWLGWEGLLARAPATGDRFRKHRKNFPAVSTLRVQIRLTGSQSSIGKLGKGVKPQVKERQGDL